MRIVLLVGLMCGLCAPAGANTTESGVPAGSLVVGTAPAGGAPATVPETGSVPMPVTGEERPLTAPVPARAPIGGTSDVGSQGNPVPAINGKPVKIALLLPLQSEVFGAAAQAVRTGFEVAYEREKAGIDVAVLQVADDAQAAVGAYADAVARYDIVVGPLARADVAAVAQSGKVSKPTLALTQPDTIDGVDITLPPNMLAIGLSIEDEARQLARWAASGKKPGKAFAIATGTAWQRRAAQAFATQWQQLGGEPQTIDISASGGYIGAASLVMLKKRLQEEHPALLFFALDEVQARQLRFSIGKEYPAYGTSQLNPFSAADWRTAQARPEMNGVRLIDIPWQLQPDHPAVMIYPRTVVPVDQTANPDLDRLYALGIDAFRIAREIALHHTDFTLDGVTGKLAVGFGKGAARFARTLQQAVYQDGVVVPLPAP